MISLGSKAAVARGASRKLAHLVQSGVPSSPSVAVSSNTAAVSVAVRRSLASTPVIDFVPESVREAVKSTVLDEATKPGSKFWGDSPTQHSTAATDAAAADADGRGGRHCNYGGSSNAPPASPTTASVSEAGVAAVAQRWKGAANGTHHGHRAAAAPMPSGAINDPISPPRVPMLHDPLDEWYLDRKPRHGRLAGGSSLHVLPPGVAPLEDGGACDPFVLAKDDMENLSESIRTDLIGSDHPVLARAASYFFEQGREGGKKVRPMMVMLLSRAMAASASASSAQAGVDDAVNGWPQQRHDLPEAQRRLAEISEMIHTASLFHDDVIDGSDTRRGSPSVHSVFGDKMAILAGDYLLARASVYLARLRDVEVVETMSTIIEHLVRGEVMQMKGSGDGDGENERNERLVYYLRKNFYKTGSLMANSCKSAAILGSYPDHVVSAAYQYGKHVGMAFQLVDDVLDFDGSASTMGKPALSDLNAGLATAPVLFAAEMFPQEMDAMIGRKFGQDGDVELAVDLVRRSDGIDRTKDLAHVYAELAIDALMELEANPYRDSLVHLAYKVVDRVR